MRIFRCPKCGHQAIAWDARSGAFLCYALGCNAWFSPPSPDEAGVTNVAVALTLGQIELFQNWFDNQADEPIRATEAGELCAHGQATVE